MIIWLNSNIAALLGKSKYVGTMLHFPSESYDEILRESCRGASLVSVVSILHSAAPPPSPAFSTSTPRQNSLSSWVWRLDPQFLLLLTLHSPADPVSPHWVKAGKRCRKFPLVPWKSEQEEQRETETETCPWGGGKTALGITESFSQR